MEKVVVETVAVGSAEDDNADEDEPGEHAPTVKRECKDKVAIPTGKENLVKKEQSHQNSPKTAKQK